MFQVSPDGAIVSNKIIKHCVNGHVYNTLALACAKKNHIIIFGNFLDIRENAEWSCFPPPGKYELDIMVSHNKQRKFIL